MSRSRKSNCNRARPLGLLMAMAGILSAPSDMWGPLQLQVGTDAGPGRWTRSWTSALGDAPLFPCTVPAGDPVGVRHHLPAQVLPLGQAGYAHSSQMKITAHPQRPLTWPRVIIVMLASDSIRRGNEDSHRHSPTLIPAPKRPRGERPPPAGPPCSRGSPQPWGPQRCAQTQGHDSQNGMARSLAPMGSQEMPFASGTLVILNKVLSSCCNFMIT